MENIMTVAEIVTEFQPATEPQSDFLDKDWQSFFDVGREEDIAEAIRRGISLEEYHHELQDNANKTDNDNKEREKKKTKHEVRREFCGTFNSFPNLHTGLMSCFRFKCGLWRNEFCKLCLEERTKEYHALVAMSMHHTKSTYVLENIPMSDYRVKLVKSMGKKDYLLFPHPDDRVTIFLKEPVVPHTRRLDIVGLRSIDFKTLVQTPDNRRISGNLGKVAAKVEKGTVIEIPTMYTDAPVDVQMKTYATTVAQTCDLDPHTPEEVKDAVTRRVNAQAELLRARGYCTIMSVASRKLTRNPEWAVYTSCFLADPTRKSYFPPSLFIHEHKVVDLESLPVYDWDY